MLKICPHCNQKLNGFYKIENLYHSEVYNCDNKNCKFDIYSKFHIEYRKWDGKIYYIWGILINVNNEWFRINSNSVIEFTTYSKKSNFISPNNWEKLCEENSYFILSDNIINDVKEKIKRKFFLKVFE